MHPCRAAPYLIHQVAVLGGRHRRDVDVLQRIILPVCQAPHLVAARTVAGCGEERSGGTRGVLDSGMRVRTVELLGRRIGKLEGGFNGMTIKIVGAWRCSKLRVAQSAQEVCWVGAPREPGGGGGGGGARPLGAAVAQMDKPAESLMRDTSGQ